MEYFHMTPYHCVESSLDAAPHWLAERVVANPTTPVALANSEVVVIGGGIMGIATAYWLSRFGLRPLLLEVGQLASGASGRNAGLMLAGSGPLENPQLVQEVLREEAIDAGYAVPGHLALASSESVWEKICAEADRRQQTASPVYALDHSACEELLGMRINCRFLGGRWYPQGGVIHPLRFIEGLASAAQRHGATIVVNTPVQQVKQLPGSDSSEVHTTCGKFVARHIVYACSAQLTTLVPALSQYITYVRGQMMSTCPLPRLFSIGLAVDWGSLYWRQIQDGTILLGGYRSLDPESETSDRAKLNPRIQQALTRFLPETFPDFPPFRVHRRWAGIMDSPVDNTPLIGALPIGRNQWVIAGFGGHGLPIALGAGQALASSIAHQRIPDALRPFDPARFARLVLMEID